MIEQISLDRKPDSDSPTRPTKLPVKLAKMRILDIFSLEEATIFSSQR